MACYKICQNKLVLIIPGVAGTILSFVNHTDWQNISLLLWKGI